MNILILGAAGMIGSNMAHWLIDNTNNSVIGIDNLSTGDLRNTPTISDRFVFFKDDVLDGGSVDRIFKEFKPDVCYAFQAYAAEGRSNHIRSFIHYNNTVGMANVINHCVNHKCKLIFTSSVAVYSGKIPYTEETIPNPKDEYGLSKWTTERSIKIAGETQELDWVIIRPRNVYGPRQCLFDPARNLFGIFCYNALNNLPLKIYGDGTNKRSFTYIDDILPCLFRAAFISKEEINLGSGVSYSIAEATNIFSKIAQYGNIVHVEARDEVKEAYCTTFLSRERLFFTQDTTLEAGLTKMWEWAKVQPMQPLQTPPKLEVTINKHSSVI